MSVEVLAAAGAALTVGALAAQINGPLSCSWPAKGADLLARLVAVRDTRTRGKARSGLGAAALAVLLTCGALTAYAAQPSAPDILPKEVSGVVGSGDQLSLQVKAADAAAPRTIRVGEEYRDGWILSGLTSAVATLTKDSQSREVGLNPSGIVGSARADGAPSGVSVVGESCGAIRASAPLDAATVGLLYTTRMARVGTTGRPSPYVDQPGLTVEENQRYAAYQQLNITNTTACNAASAPSTGLQNILVGEAYDDWRALEVKRIDNRMPVPAVTGPVRACIAACANVTGAAGSEILFADGSGGGMSVPAGRDPVQFARETGLVTSLDGVALAPLYPPTRAEIAAGSKPSGL